MEPLSYKLSRELEVGIRLAVMRHKEDIKWISYFHRPSLMQSEDKEISNQISDNIFETTYEEIGSDNLLMDWIEKRLGM